MEPENQFSAEDFYAPAGEGFDHLFPSDAKQRFTAADGNRSGKGRFPGGSAPIVWSGCLALDAKVLDDRLGSAADVKLLEDVGQVIAHGAGSNAHLLRNLLVR